MAKSESKTFVVYREIWSRFAKPFTRLFIIAIFLMIIVSASSSIYPEIMQQVFNHLSGEETFIKHNFITVVPIIIILIARDAIAKVIYSKTFEWVVKTINKSNSHKDLRLFLNNQYMSHLIVQFV